jgi:hypothetical protein
MLFLEVDGVPSEQDGMFSQKKPQKCEERTA